MYCCKPREEEYITAGDWVKGISACACRSVFLFVPETSGASIKVLEDNEGVKALINNAPELS